MGKITTLEASWREWVVTNLRRCCSHESIVASMVEKEFDAEFAKTVVAALAAETLRGSGDAVTEQRMAAMSRAIGVQGSDEPGRAAEIPVSERLGYVAEPSRIPLGNVLRTSDRVVQVLTRMEKPELL